MLEEKIILEMIKNNLIKPRKRAGGYEARVTLNKRSYSASAKTSKLALLKLQQKMESLSIENTPDVLTYGKWLSRWYETYKKPNLKKSSLYGIDVIIRLHIPEKLKKLELSEIKSYMLQQVLNEVKNSRTRQLVYCVFTDSLGKAYREELIEKDVSGLLEPVKHRKKVGKALTQEEQDNFLKAIVGHKAEIFFKFCLFSGCRRSEALSVRWRDIDFTAETIKIRGTKTEGSLRTIPLFPDLKELLEGMEKKSDLLFSFNPDYVTRCFKKFCSNHKLHDLRHTFATRAMECGISVAVVSCWLGHSNIDTTVRVYTHVLDDHQKVEAEKLKI